jgi:hypothetical protein
MKGVPVNPSALTSVKQAFIAGGRAALRRVGIAKCSYKSPILIEAFERGYRKFKQEMEKK